MMNLTLHAGPRLARFPYMDEAAEPGTIDVTENAIGYLFEQVTIQPNVTLADVLRLFDLCPKLHEAFRRHYSVSLCEEARKGQIPARASNEPSEVTDIEYLELYWRWGLDTNDNTYSSVNHLGLHGQGVELAIDAPDYHRSVGERIQWSVSLTPVRELLSLPIRLAENFEICEGDRSAKVYGLPLQKAKCSEITLGQFLHGIISELSFHGDQQGKDHVVASLKESMDEIDKNEATLIPHEDVMESFDLYRVGFNTMFETLGDVRKSRIQAVLFEIDDDEPVGPVMDRSFEGQVVVKEWAYHLPGRAFRRAFNTAGE